MSDLFSDLISKFDTVNVSEHQQIPQVDIDYCEKLQSQYQACLDDLLRCEQRLERELKESQNKYVSIEQYGRSKEYHASRDYNIANNTDDIFCAMYYTPAYSLAWLKNRKPILQQMLTKNIISYFQSKYKVPLDIDDDYLEVAKKPIHYTHLIDAIIKKLGGVSFRQKSITELIDDVKNIPTYQTNLTIKNNVISFINCLYFETSYSIDSTKKLEYRNTSMYVLGRALSLFEFDEAYNDLFNFIQFNGLNNSVDFNSWYDYHKPENCKKFVAYRMFLNRKLDLKFTTAAHAQEFIDMFGLNTLKESRW